MNIPGTWCWFILVGTGGVTFATFVGRTNSGLIRPWPGLFKNREDTGDADVPPGDLHRGSSAPPAPAGPAMGMNMLCLAPTPGTVLGLERWWGEGLGSHADNDYTLKWCGVVGSAPK